MDYKFSFRVFSSMTEISIFTVSSGSRGSMHSGHSIRQMLPESK